MRKWYGVVAEDSKNSPSIDPMHPSVQYGSNISAIGVPMRSSSDSYSHIARPQPCFALTRFIVLMTSRYSG